jgi:alginate O-acetyltransferase complex protein AlgI
MVFNSLQFAAFFAVVYALYRVLPHRAQNLMLLGASYVFYAAWDWRFLSLLLDRRPSTIPSPSPSRDDPGGGRRRLLLTISLVFNLGLLGFFKYFNFFADNLGSSSVRARLGPVVRHGAKVLLPMGISFYTFMTMSYVIDVYRRQFEPDARAARLRAVRRLFPPAGGGPDPARGALLPQITTPSRSRGNSCGTACG